MKSSDDLTVEVDRLAREGRHDEAVVLIDEMDRAGFATSDLQVRKGDLIQLGDSETYSIRDAEAAYSRAVDMDPTNVRAHLALGWFRLNVEDDAAAACASFDAALELANGLREEAARGRAECLHESS